MELVLEKLLAILQHLVDMLSLAPADLPASVEGRTILLEPCSCLAVWAGVEGLKHALRKSKNIVALSVLQHFASMQLSSQLWPAPT
eukprot:6199566-Pleurochrysis_carterae.AAC.2